MNTTIHRSLIAISMALVVATSSGIVFGEGVVPPTRGETMLENAIDAASARLAELNVALNPKMGIIHTLRRHSVGNDVKLLQQFLKVYGAYPAGKITGYFGPLTEAAVKNFQTKESLDSIGVAGPKTRARIIEISQQKMKRNAKAAGGVPVLASASTSTPIPTSDTGVAPEVVDAVLTADVAENGAAVAPVVSFASTTQNIYATLSLKNARQDAQIAYIRYYGNNYIDSEITHPSRSNLKYLHFQWSLKPGSSRSAGSYSVTFYLNGKNAKTIHYTIY